MKRIVILLLSLALLVACVPTPDEEPIINRTDAYENSESVTVNAPQNVIGGAAATEPGLRIDEEYTTPRGVQVTIHADVTVPGETNIPIVRVQTCKFSKEQVLKWIGILAPGASLCEQPKDPFSREYYAECVKRTQEALETETDPNEIDYFQGTLQYYIDAYNNAKPESEIDRDKAFDADQIDKKKSCNIVLRRDGKTVGSIQIFSETDDDYPRYVFEYAPAGRQIYTGDVDVGDPRSEQMPFSEQDAIKTANAFLEALGIVDMQHVFSEIMFRHDMTVNKIDQSPSAYRLLYTRTTNGMPKPHYWIASWKLGFAESDKQEYKPTWTPEYIDIMVDAQGVQSFRWQNPVEVVETVNENVQVISFEEARKAFDSYIDILRSSGTYINSDSPIEITDIVFGYEFFSVKDSLTTFDMVPCWFFLGYDGESRLFHMKGAQLIINATDGKLPLSE